MKKPKRPPQKQIPSGLVATVAQSMHDRIRDKLSEAKASLSQYQTLARIHMSDDFIIDAELSVTIPRGINAHDVMTDLDEAMRPFPTRVSYRTDPDEPSEESPQAWVSTGVKVPLRPDDIYSGRYAIHKRGITHAGSFYRRGRAVGSAFNTGKRIIKNFANKGKRKPESIYVRIHWNPHDIQPTREG